MYVYVDVLLFFIAIFIFCTVLGVVETQLMTPLFQSYLDGTTHQNRVILHILIALQSSSICKCMTSASCNKARLIF